MMLAPAPGKTAPWMVAMESQLQALSIMKRATAAPSKNQKIWMIGKMLNAAVPFMWSKETTQAVLAASRSVPLETTLDEWNINTDAAWWYFEEPLPFQTVGLKDVGLGIRALCLAWAYYEPEKVVFPAGSDLKEVEDVLLNGPQLIKDLRCSFWVDDATKEFSILPSQGMLWAEHETLDIMIHRSQVAYQKDRNCNNSVDSYMNGAEGAARFILAGLAWLGQKVIVESDGHIERHRRKDFNRQTGQELSAVRVISLRRSEHTTHRETTANCRCGHAAFDHLQGRNGYESCAECGCPKFETDKVEWSCRWTVDGHWRNQPVGINRSERRLTWINPYVKGPDDKELRVPRRKVYVVNR